MGAKQSIKNPKDRERTSVRTEEPSELRPEISKTDVNYNEETTIIRVQPPCIRPKLPYYLNKILKESESPLEIDRLSMERLYNGVYLKQNKKVEQLKFPFLLFLSKLLFILSYTEVCMILFQNSYAVVIIYNIFMIVF